MNPINWIKNRIEERTTWDGAALILICLLYTSDAADE